MRDVLLCQIVNNLLINRFEHIYLILHQLYEVVNHMGIDVKTKMATASLVTQLADTIIIDTTLLVGTKNVLATF